MSDLSLLPNQAKFQAARIKIKERVSALSWIFGTIWLGSVLIIFTVWLLFQGRLTLAQRDYQKIFNQYKSLSDNVFISQQLKFKAKLVGQVLAGRFEYGKSLKLVNDLFPKNIAIDNYELKDPKVFLVKGHVDDDQNMDELENEIININNGAVAEVKSVKLTSLSLNINTWQFEMEVNLK